MLGHELTHIRNGDVRMLVIAVVIAGVISFFAEMVFRVLFQGGFRFGAAAAAAAATAARAPAAWSSPSSSRWSLIAVAWLLSIVIRFALSRKREYLADAGAVELTKNPDAMITALRKIENRGELEGATSAVMEMCVDNPRSGFADLFATHPSIDSRVAAIVQFAGGHDPGPIALPEPDAPAGAKATTRDADRLADRARRCRRPGRRRRSAPAATSRSCPRSRRLRSAASRPARQAPSGPWGPPAELMPSSG